MQIHELDTYIGTPSDSDFLAVDDGTETTKIPITDVGITTEMTQAEAETGTETAPRVVSPAVLNSFVTAQGESILASVADLFVVEDFISADNLVAGSGSTAVTIPFSKPGYTALGIVGIRKTGSGHSYVTFYNEYINPTAGNIYVGLRNVSTNAITVEITAKILFVKN